MQRSVLQPAVPQQPPSRQAPQTQLTSKQSVIGFQSLSNNTVRVKDGQLIVQGPDQARVEAIAEQLSSGKAKLGNVCGKQVLVIINQEARTASHSLAEPPFIPVRGQRNIVSKLHFAQRSLVPSIAANLSLNKSHVPALQSQTPTAVQASPPLLPGTSQAGIALLSGQQLPAPQNQTTARSKKAAPSPAIQQLFNYNSRLDESIAKEIFAIDVKKMINSDSCDMVIKCGDKIFPVHKCFLMARSEVLKVFLEENSGEKKDCKITIEESTPEAVAKMIDFIYTGELPSLTNDMAMDLFRLADKYMLKHLKKACGKIVMANASPGSFIETFKFMSSSFKSDVETDVLGIGKTFFKKNAKAIMSDGKVWMDFTAENPELALELVRMLG